MEAGLVLGGLAAMIFFAEGGGRQFKPTNKYEEELRKSQAAEARIELALKDFKP